MMPPNLLVTNPSTAGDRSQSPSEVVDDRLTAAGYQSSPGLLYSPQLGNPQRQSAADTFGRPYSAAPSPNLHGKSSQETF